MQTPNFQIVEKKERKHTACLGCRIRRRKCDNVKPICSGCQEINIPADLCLYHGARVGFKVNGSKKTLEKLRDKKTQLLKEQAALTRVGQRRSQYQASEAYYLPSYHNNQFKKNPLMCTMGDVSGTLTHYGPISWFALISVQEPLKKLSTWFINVMKFEKDRYNKSKFEKKVEEDNVLRTLNKLLIEFSLGCMEIPDKYSLLNQILSVIVSKLPIQSVSEELLKFYFHLNQQRAVGFVYLDMDSFYEKLEKYISFDDQGKAHLTMSLPKDQDGLSFIMLYLSMLTYQAFFASTLNTSSYPQVNHLQMLEYLETLLLASEVLQSDESFGISPFLDPETLLAIIHVCVFQRCTPHGNISRGIIGGNDVLIVRQLIVYARILRLDEDIDVAYQTKTPEYRKSLKSIWYCLMYFDISEGLETGIPLKIKPKELERYKNENLYIRSMIVINDVLNQFNDNVLMVDKLKLIDWIQNTLAPQLDNFLKKEFPSAEEHIEYLEKFDFDNINDSHKYVWHLQMAAIRILIYSTSASFYHFCATVTDQVGVESKKFRYIAMKRMGALVVFIRNVLNAAKILSEHKNSSYFSLVSSLLVISRQMTFALRRVSIYIGGMVVRNYDQQYSLQFLSTLMNDSDRYAKTLLDTLIKTSDYHSFSFSLDSLENFEIEKNFDELDKFYFRLDDYKFLAFENCRILQQMMKSLENKKYNLNFLRLDYIFFYGLTASNLFLALAFSSDEIKDNAKVAGKIPDAHDDNGNNIETEHQTEISDASRNNDFDFNDLFERAIDTNSERFDFKSFFTTSNDLYQHEDIEQFLENLTMPLSDYYSNNSPFF